MRLHTELQESLARATALARQLRHEFVTMEHVLLELCGDNLAAPVLESCGVDCHLLQNDLQAFLESEIEAVPDHVERFDPQYTIGTQVVLQMAATQVHAAGKEEIHGGHILVALFEEEQSHALFYLRRQNVTRFDVVSALSHGAAHEVITRISADETSESASRRPAADPLARYCESLNERVKAGKVDPLIGRADEIERIVHVLLRRRKNNPLLIGDAGVGKTALAEGLAYRIEHDDVPEPLIGVEIFALDMASVLAGTKFRGEFEERLKGVVEALKDQPKRILFVDEIQTIIGAGSVSGGSMDASNLLKPALANGEIRCMGTTTFEDYRATFTKDHALSRRFQPVEVHEPSRDDCVQIVKGLAPHYAEFHNVKYSDKALTGAVDLTSRYLPERRLPDKAIDVIDEAGAALKLKNRKGVPTVSVRDIERVVAKIGKVPPASVQTDDRERLGALQEHLQRVIYGQDTAIGHVVDAIQLSRAGLRSGDKPIGSFLFAGPTGVGKTELAKQLSKQLGVAFIRFDMSEYMEKHTVSRLIGSPPGYVGHEKGGLLTDAIHRTPHAVLLLDEIEKAHEDIYNLLLQVMDHASLTDANGRKTDFREVVLIMTTNTGARESQVRSIGFGKSEFEDKSKAEIEKKFAPEFRNRLTATIQFAPLAPQVMVQIVEKSLVELTKQLSAKKVTLDIDDSAKKRLAELGYDPQYGARPLERVMQEQLAKPIAKQLLFGDLKSGGVARVVLESKKLHVVCAKA